MQYSLNRVLGIAAFVASFGVALGACGGSSSSEPGGTGGLGGDPGTDAAAGQAGSAGNGGGTAGAGGSSGSAGIGGSAGTAGVGGSAGTAGAAGAGGSAGTAGASGAAGTAGAAGGGGFVTIRLMASNLSSGNDQSYDAGHGQRIIQGLKPDVVMMQEFNYGSGSDSDIRSFVDKTLGTSYSYYRETNVQIPNGIISKYPIIQGGVWEDSEVNNRNFVWARIDVPGPTDLWAVSVHLLTTGSGDRNKQATALIKFAQAVPVGDFFAVGGDFNVDSRSEACLTTFKARLVTAAPYPADQKGNDDTNASRAKPYDWVIVSPNLNAYKTPLQIGASTYANGLVFDSRVYTPLAEVAPVQKGDSGATNMQHMGILKDFLIPN